MNEPYVGAPYNFVEFPRVWVSRYDRMEDLPPHDHYLAEHLTGMIEFAWQAETPVFINDGSRKGHFFTNHEGYAIPGSTVRGLIRSHVQVLGMSNWRDDIRNVRFLYRDMTSRNNRLRDEYKAVLGLASAPKMQRQREERKISLPSNLKAGYIKKVQDDYFIIPAVPDRNGNTYYRVPESFLRTLNLESIGVKLMYNETLWQDYKPGMTSRDFRREYHNTSYSPYMCRVSYSLKDDGRRIHRIEPPDVSGPGMEQGWLLSSGRIAGKMTHYLVREPDLSHPGIQIPKELVESYEQDLIRKKLGGSHQRNRSNDFYQLPQNQGIKPVFYAQSDKLLYFGFTPYLRVFYDHDIHHGIPEAFRTGWKLDYAKSLFGFSAQKEYGVDQSYKGRVAFEDMQAEGQPKEMDPVKVVLGEPKATAYSLYLKQPEAEKGVLRTYNSPDFELRGMKQYWLKTRIHPESTGNPRVDAEIRPLDRGTVFRGRIRFFNLTEDELGLLLWALMLEPGCSFQVGMAKPYGFGQMKLLQDSVKLKIENLERKYRQTNLTFRDDFMDEKDPMFYIQKYKEYMKTNYRIDIDTEPHIHSFFTMRKVRLEPEKARYMKIGSGVNEYRSLDPLPNVEEVAKGVRRRFRKADLHNTPKKH